MFLALFSEYEVNVNVNGSTEPISSMMAIVEMGKNYPNGKFHYHLQWIFCTNVSATPLRQWGFRQCLPFSWTTLTGKHCRHPIAIMGVVGTCRHVLT